MIIGRNAYGALLVMEDGNKMGHESIYVELDNLQLDGLVDHYQTTGPIYADAMKKRKK